MLKVIWYKYTLFCSENNEDLFVYKLTESLKFQEKTEERLTIENPSLGRRVSICLPVYMLVCERAYQLSTWLQ